MKYNKLTRTCGLSVNANALAVTVSQTPCDSTRRFLSSYDKYRSLFLFLLMSTPRPTASLQYK